MDYYVSGDLLMTQTERMRVRVLLILILTSVLITHAQGLALMYILENSFKAESGSRSDVPKIVILITDGKSQDDVFLPAQRLRDAGIELFAIGVKNADENELRAIASPPEETHVYNVDDFSFMLDIMEKLTRSVCERISELNGEEVPDARTDAPSDLMTSEVTARRPVHSSSESLRAQVKNMKMLSEMLLFVMWLF
ncbi:collagen alpha-1(XIV) chain-like protein [Labeo rohita]|uniref:Collagen alpha-1(XIV) chain-like protein n=1 Tax=Labeo rohita TaxID=84645 RepID=A0A498M6N7_LABRO|nr:collagen alpha-1(XIV) chain-like protein [Labeo rohita]